MLGCGRIAGLVHVPVLNSLRAVELVAVAERDRTSTGLLSIPEKSVELYDDWRSLLELANVDAVVITLPPALHTEAAQAAFERGKHVYLEKPVGIQLSQTRAMTDRWQASGKVGMTGFNFRFNPLFEQARRMLSDGRIGKVLSTHTVFTSRGEHLPEWKKHRESGGGALLDLASHHFDLLPWLLDSAPLSVGCHLQSINTEDDCSSVDVRFENGVVSEVFTSIAASEEHRLEITGSSGTMLIDLNRADRVELLGPTLAQARLRRLAAATHAFGNPAYWVSKMTKKVREVSFERALEKFCQAALNGRQVRPDLHDGYRSLSLVKAAMESARTGCQVKIRENHDEDFTG